MIWIFAYVVLVNIGDALSGQIGIAHATTALLLVILSVVLVLYGKRSGSPNLASIRTVTSADMQKTLLYIPLFVLALIQLLAGIKSSISVVEIGAICLLMAGVGFIEEVLFRGLLLEAIAEKTNVNRAVIISGVTFGLGHIVNALRGYDLSELSAQILAAITIGIVLSLLVVITKNLVPGILFHVVFNITGSITNQGGTAESYLLVSIVGISVAYALYLYKHGKSLGKL